MEICDALVAMIRKADRAGARVLIEGWADEHGHDDLFASVLEPTLQLIGEEWKGIGTVTLAQAYVAAKIAEDALSMAASRTQQRKESKVPAYPVVIGNIEEDFHSLGRNMVGIFLRVEGWQVYDLGNDVEPKDFVDKALEVGARVIGASAMTLSTARNIKSLREEIDRRGLRGRIQLAVGGAVFLLCPSLVEEVGGDGTAKNAIEAAKLFAALWEKAQKEESSQ